MNDDSQSPGLLARLSERYASPVARGLTPRRRQYDSGQLDEYIFRNRKVAYRYILIALAVILAPINAHNYYAGFYMPATAGLAVLTLFVANIYLLAGNREPFLGPVAVLMITLGLVVISLAYGQSYNLYWVYPLLVALPVLLKTRVAVWLGILVGLLVTPFVWMRFDTGTAIIVSLSMAHTWLISAWLMYAVSEQSRQLSEMAITDPLTGAFNRRRLKTEAKQAYQVWQRYQRPSTLLLIDVDFFKSVNDEYGHEKGDQALQLIVEILHQRLRKLDLVFRYGGEEFVALLAETDESRAIHVAEELRSHIEQARILPSRPVTVSIGVCDVTQAESTEHWLNLCDRALYQAKSQGRNQVIMASPGL